MSNSYTVFDSGEQITFPVKNNIDNAELTLLSDNTRQLLMEDMKKQTIFWKRSKQFAFN